MLTRQLQHRRIKDISEGNFHTIHANNQAEKFKLKKLSQGIESCRNAQFLKFRREEKQLIKTLAKFDKEKSKHISEDEQFFLKYSPGDGVTMLSYSDLLPKDAEEEEEEEEEEENQSDSQHDQEDVDSWEDFHDSLITEDDKNEEKDLNDSIAERKIGVLQEELRRFSLGEEARENCSYAGSERSEMRRSSHGQQVTRKASTKDSGRRRFSLDMQDEVVPFYLKKKYDHHYDEQRGRLLSRRKTLTLEEQRNLFEKQLLGPSADLGTVSFKSGFDRSWLNADLRKEREEAVKRMLDEDIEMANKRRPNSGFARIRMAIERLPSESPPSQSALTSARVTQLNVQATDSVDSEHRWNTMSTASSRIAFEDKMPLLNQRRHTIGEVPPYSSSLKKANLDNLKSFKSLRAIDCSPDALSFDDKGVVFPAHTKDRSYTLKEFISLRKCRYLRLSKLNWESLLWQSKHQTLLNY